jgi:hypothetical protein
MIQQVSKTETRETKQSSECRHHWVIEPPIGPVSRGVCQVCEAVREFKNYIDAAPWGEDANASQASSKFARASTAEDTEVVEEE